MRQLPRSASSIALITCAAAAYFLLSAATLLWLNTWFHNALLYEHAGGSLITPVSKGLADGRVNVGGGGCLLWRAALRPCIELIVHSSRQADPKLAFIGENPCSVYELRALQIVLGCGQQRAVKTVVHFTNQELDVQPDGREFFSVDTRYLLKQSSNYYSGRASK